MSSSARLEGFILSLSCVLACADPEEPSNASVGRGGVAATNGAGADNSSPPLGGGSGTAGTTAMGGSGSVAMGGTSATGGASGGETSMPDAGDTFDPCAPTGQPVPLPLVVDDHFVLSGYFAGPDAVTAANLPPAPAPGAIVAGVCDPRPENPAGHFGDCHRFTFHALATAGDPPSAFGGIFWQGPADNWGTLPGIAVAPGASAVRFRAWGVVGGEVVSFNAGGIDDPNLACRDSVDRGGPASNVALTLTTTPTDYTIPLTGETYENGVLGAFNWVVAVTSTDEEVSFFVDDIRWTAE
jgi:hypothetical protein